jgi:hypothetical protein
MNAEEKANRLARRIIAQEKAAQVTTIPYGPGRVHVKFLVHRIPLYTAAINSVSCSADIYDNTSAEELQNIETEALRILPRVHACCHGVSKARTRTCLLASQRNRQLTAGQRAWERTAPQASRRWKPTRPTS